jgi:cysteinyl-tRNA synthetase
MSIRLSNTRTRTTEDFVPLRDREVRIYVCGLTPSADAHLGHARSFIFFDVLRRYLIHRGYRVTYVVNVTDIDDRSINTARETGEDWRDIVERNFRSFKDSMRRLHVHEPDFEPRVTGNIEPIVRMIGELIATGHAYVAGDGVYFRVRSFPRYGQLSGKNIEELEVGARIAPGEEKDDPLDFALWKFAKGDEPRWPSPWGDGRPGWHIECSAMAREVLGVPFDIHGGGHDLVFPHHENEIAQSESLMAHPPMATYWVHAGLLNFDGKKMSKSLGNFEPLSALLDRHDAQAIRLLFLRTGYGKPAEFNEDVMADVTTSLSRLLDAYDLLREAPAGADDREAGREAVEPYARRFYAALDDDMNAAGALAELFKIAGEAQAFVAAGTAAAVAGFMHEAMSVLGISPSERTLQKPRSRPVAEVAAKLRAAVGSELSFNGETPEAAIEAVIAARNAARLSKDFALADRLRDALGASGVVINDGKDGTTWTIAAGG